MTIYRAEGLQKEYISQAEKVRVLDDINLTIP